MSTKGHRRITCPTCHQWVHLRLVTHLYGQRITPPLDPPEYIIPGWHRCLTSEQGTRIANADKGDLAALNAAIREETAAKFAEWAASERGYRLERAKANRHRNPIPEQGRIGETA